MAKKYIDADRLKAEIKRQKHELELSIQSQGDYGQSCHIVAYDNILSLIDSLQQDQPGQDLTEFKKALDSFSEACENNDEYPSAVDIARYFYELGLNVRKVE